MKKKLVSKSAFFSLRFLTGFALCSVGVFLAMLVFARSDKPIERPTSSPAQSFPTSVGVALPTVQQAIAQRDSIKSVEKDYVADLAALGVHPTSAPLPLRVLASGDASTPEGSAMGTGKAFMGITQEVVNQNISTGAFGVLSSGWTPGESVQVFFNGLLVLTAAANADGIVAVNAGTGAGFGCVRRAVGVNCAETIQK